MSSSIDPEYWGRGLWEMIHWVAAGYPKEPTDEDKKSYESFYKILGQVLPCLECRKHYEDILQDIKLDENSLNNDTSLRQWGVDVHNRVNKDTTESGPVDEWSLEQLDLYYPPADLNRKPLPLPSSSQAQAEAQSQASSLPLSSSKSSTRISDLRERLANQNKKRTQRRTKTAVTASMDPAVQKSVRASTIMHRLHRQTISMGRIGNSNRRRTVTSVPRVQSLKNQARRAMRSGRQPIAVRKKKGCGCSKNRR